MANDPELLALPLRQMDLSGGSSKILKSLGHKTIGDVLAASPGALASAGLAGPALREIATAARELGLEWVSDAEISAAAPRGEPVTLDLPKAIAKLVRPTFVLEEWGPPSNVAMSERCSTCDAPLALLMHLDLSAFPESQLPSVSVRAGRCIQADCRKFLLKPGQWAVLVESAGGDRPRYRRENDYPSDGELPKLPSERVSTVLSEHKYDTIGVVSRVGGWPNAAHAIKPWPTCTSCTASLVLAFQRPTEAEQELVFICPLACSGSGTYMAAVD